MSTPNDVIAAPVNEEEREDRAADQERRTIELANSIPDAKGLEEIKDPFLKAAVADALDFGRDPVLMDDLAGILDMVYPKAAAKVKKQAEFLSRIGAMNAGR